MKTKVFISWSGTASQRIAGALNEWIPSVIQAVEPWMSSDDIRVGTRWADDIARRLQESKFGIICLTPDNLEAPWVLFEAGALSKTLAKTFVCPYLFHVEPTDLTGPLTQFQAAKADEEGTRRLIETLNKALGDDRLTGTDIAKYFGKWWPDLEKQLHEIEPVGETETAETRRSERDLIEETLGLVRAISRDVNAWRWTDGQWIDLSSLSPSASAQLDFWRAASSGSQLGRLSEGVRYFDLPHITAPSSSRAYVQGEQQPDTGNSEGEMPDVPSPETEA
jgi:hypothetical protein